MKPQLHYTPCPSLECGLNYFGLFYIDEQTAAKANYTSMLHNPWRRIKLI